MKLLIASLATAALSGCVGYVPYYGAAEAYPGYGPAAYPYAYRAAPAYPVYGYGGISYGATIVLPGRGYGRWSGRDWHGDRGSWGGGWHR